MQPKIQAAFFICDVVSLIGFPIYLPTYLPTYLATYLATNLATNFL